MRAHRGKSTTARRITDRSEHSKDPNGHYAGRGVDVLPPTGVECLRPTMRTEEPYKNRIELLQGTLDMLILQTLQWRPRHGYAIAQGIRSGSDEVLLETARCIPRSIGSKREAGCGRPGGPQRIASAPVFTSLRPKGRSNWLPSMRSGLRWLRR
jgi:hypothetical protein